MQKHIATDMDPARLKLICAGFAEKGSSWKGRVVSSPYSRLYIITENSFFLDIQNKARIELTQGNCYLVPAGLSFDFGCLAPMKHFYFHLQLTSFNGLDLLKSVDRVLSIPYTDIPDLSLDASEIIRNLNFHGFVCSALFSVLKENGLSLETEHYSKEVREAIKYIRQNLSIQLNIKDIAEKAFTAPSTLTRNFRREMGMSVGEYIDFLILKKAEELVVSTDLSVREIGERFGFCDQFYFSRRFKEKYGTSPLRYRALPRA